MTEPSRFPFGIPRGWFVILFSSELDGGAPRPIRAFGRDLVVYRGASGEPHLVDAYCPHLGAHLGHGGCVEGASIRCPFHRWRFDAEGHCVEVPGSPLAPKRARLRTYPVREQNGTVFAFHDPRGGAPWDLPVLDEEGWTERKTVHWRDLSTHPQEVFENTVDTAHIGPVHAGIGAALKAKPHREAERMVVDVAFRAPGDIVGMPGTVNDVELTVRMIGLGVVVVDTFVRNVGVRARQRLCVLPVEEDRVDIRGIVQVRQSEDAAFTEELARVFHQAFVDDFAKDFPIWENKRFLPAPLLSPIDGPIGLYRRWCEQFYDAPASAQSAPAPSPLATLRTKAGALLAPMRARLAERLAAIAPRGVERAAAAETETAEATFPAAPAPRPARRVTSAEDYFTTLPERFVPEASGGVDAVFQWELGGATFHAEVRDGALSVREGAHAQPTVSLVIPEREYVKVVNGELDGTWAFTSGIGKVRGSLAAAMKMRSLFPA